MSLWRRWVGVFCLALCLGAASCSDDAGDSGNSAQPDVEDDAGQMESDVDESDDAQDEADAPPEDVDESQDVVQPPADVDGPDGDEPDADDLDVEEVDVDEADAELDLPDDVQEPEDVEDEPGDIDEEPDVELDVPEDVEDVEDEPDVSPPPPLPTVELVEIGVLGSLKDVWAQSPQRVFIAGDVPAQIINGRVLYWPPAGDGIQRSNAVTGSPNRGVVYTADHRPGAIGRFDAGQWTSTRFARETNHTHISMLEDGSRDVVLATGVDRGISWNSRANERQSGWQIFYGDRCPGEPRGMFGPDCPIDSSFLTGGEFNRDAWISAQGQIYHLYLTVQEDIIYEQRQGTAYDIFVADDDSVFTVGPDGALQWKVDGQWSQAVHLEGRDLRAVWAASGQEAWAVGDGGVALWFDGQSWRALETGTEANLRGVFGVGSQRWIVGDQGTLLWSGQDNDQAPAGEVVVPPPPDQDPAVRVMSLVDGAVLLTCTDGNEQVGSPLNLVDGARNDFVDGYFDPAPGQRFWVEVFGPNGCIGLSDGAVTVDLEVNEFQTLLISDAVNFGQDYTVLDDDLTPPLEFDGARVRVLNFAHEADDRYQNVDVCVNAETAVAAGLAGTQVSEYAELPAQDTGSILLRAASEPACQGQRLAFVSGLEFEPGGVYTLAFMERAGLEEGQLVLASCLDGLDGAPARPSTCQRLERFFYP